MTDYTKAVRIVVTARAIIFKNGCILLTSIDNKTWHNPGGWLDGFETLEECVIREVFEETGLNVIPQGVVKITEYSTTYKENRFKENVHKIEHHFLCNLTEQYNDVAIAEIEHLMLSCNDVDGQVKYRKFFTAKELVEFGDTIKPEFLANILDQQNNLTIMLNASKQIK